MVVVRAALLALWFYGVSFTVLLIAIFRPLQVANGTLFGRLLGPLSLRILNLPVEFRNHHRLLSSQPCVYIVNHQHVLDLFVLSSFFPPRAVTVGKSSLRWIPFIGWLYWLSGHVLVDRYRNERAVEALRRACRRAVREGISVLFCPEGTRSRGRGLLPFKKGAFHFALESKRPIQPIVCASYHKTVDFRRWNPGVFRIEALEPITTEGRDADSLVEEAYQVMRAALVRLDREGAISV